MGGGLRGLNIEKIEPFQFQLDYKVDRKKKIDLTLIMTLNNNRIKEIKIDSSKFNYISKFLVSESDFAKGENKLSLQLTSNDNSIILFENLKLYNYVGSSPNIPVGYIIPDASKASFSLSENFSQEHILKFVLLTALVYLLILLYLSILYLLFYNNFWHCCHRCYKIFILSVLCPWITLVYSIITPYQIVFPEETLLWITILLPIIIQIGCMLIVGSRYPAVVNFLLPDNKRGSDFIFIFREKMINYVNKKTEDIPSGSIFEKPDFNFPGTKELGVICLIALLGFSLRAIWSYEIPYDRKGYHMNYAPDESAHIIATNSITTGEFVKYVPFKYNSTNYGAFLPTPYLLHGWMGKLDSLNFSWLYKYDTGNRMYMLQRMGGHLIGTATVILGYFLGRMMYGMCFGSLIAMLLCFYPQFTFINSYINSDSYAVFSSTMVFLALYYYHLSKSKYLFRIMVLAFSFFIITIGKLSTFFFFPVIGVYIIYDAYSQKESKNLLLGILFYMILIFPWLLYGNSRYPGDPLGIKQYHYFLEYQWGGKTGLENGFPLWHYKYFTDLFESAFANFCNMSLPMHPFWFIVNNVFIGFGIYSFFRIKNDLDTKIKRFFIVSLLCCFSNFALTWYNAFFVDYQPQGRYILPCLVIYILMATYPFGIFTKTKKRFVGYYVYIYVFFIFLANIAGLFYYIIPNVFNDQPF